MISFVPRQTSKIPNMHPAVLRNKLPKISSKIKSNRSNKTSRIEEWLNSLNYGLLISLFRLWVINYGQVLIYVITLTVFLTKPPIPSKKRWNSLWLCFYQNSGSKKLLGIWLVCFRPRVGPSFKLVSFSLQSRFQNYLRRGKNGLFQNQITCWKGCQSTFAKLSSQGSLDDGKVVEVHLTLSHWS